MKPQIPSRRLLSIDVMRGITIAAMVLVNNPGSWAYVYPPLRHAEWNGLTPTDLVFPFFMFIMGLSAYMSLSKFDFRLSAASAWKVLRRTVVIYAIGFAIVWLSRFMRGLTSGSGLWEAMCSFGSIRILGVLPRLALSYGIGALIALTCGKRRLPYMTVGILVVYALILLFGHGWEFSERNVINVVDRAVLGEAHMYTDHVGGVAMKFDPEGFLSTLPSVAHVLVGFMAGMMISGTDDSGKRALVLFVLGTCLSFSGFLLDYGIPVNKKIWSPTFVLVTCGLASLLLGLLTYILDVRHKRGWCGFFEVFGANPLILYVLSTVLALLLIYIKVPASTNASGFSSLYGLIFEGFVVPLCAYHMYLASLVYALLFVGVVWLPGLILYKRKIYIKI